MGVYFDQYGYMQIGVDPRCGGAPMPCNPCDPMNPWVWGQMQNYKLGEGLINSYLSSMNCGNTGGGFGANDFMNWDINNGPQKPSINFGGAIPPTSLEVYETPVISDPAAKDPAVNNSDPADANPNQTTPQAKATSGVQPKAFDIERIKQEVKPEDIFKQPEVVERILEQWDSADFVTRPPLGKDRISAYSLSQFLEDEFGNREAVNTYFGNEQNRIKTCNKFIERIKTNHTDSGLTGPNASKKDFIMENAKLRWNQVKHMAAVLPDGTTVPYTEITAYNPKFIKYTLDNFTTSANSLGIDEPKGQLRIDSEHPIALGDLSNLPDKDKIMAAISDSQYKPGYITEAQLAAIRWNIDYGATQGRIDWTKDEFNHEFELLREFYQHNGTEDMPQKEDLSAYLGYFKDEHKNYKQAG